MYVSSGEECEDVVITEVIEVEMDFTEEIQESVPHKKPRPT